MEAITSPSAPPILSRLLNGAMDGLAFFLPISIALSNVMWGGALLVGAVVWGIERRRYRWTGLEIPWVAGWAVALLTALISADPWRSVRSLRSEVLVAVFLLAAQTGDARSLRRRLLFFAGGATTTALWGILQRGGTTLLGDAWSSLWAGLPPPMAALFSLHGGRAVGFYSHPITYAEMLFLAVVLVLGWVSDRWRWAVAVGAMGVALVFSQTRGVWLALSATLGLWTLVKRQRTGVLIHGIFFAVFLLFVGLNSTFRGRAASILDVSHEDSNRIRMGLWDKSLEKIAQHPWRGIGSGLFRVRGEDLRWGGSPPGMDWTETHNMYLQMAVERGLPGGMIFLWWLWAVGRLLWRCASRHPVTGGIFFGFLGLCAAGLTETWTNDSEILMGLYFLVGTAWALSKAEDGEPLFSQKR